MSSAKKPLKTQRTKTSGGSGQSKRTRPKVSAKRAAVAAKRGPATRAAKATATGKTTAGKTGASRTASKATASRATASKAGKSAASVAAAKRAAAAKRTLRAKARPAAAKTVAPRASVRTKTTRAAKTTAVAVRRASAKAGSKATSPASRRSATGTRASVKANAPAAPKPAPKPAAKAAVRTAAAVTRPPKAAPVVAPAAPKPAAVKLAVAPVTPAVKPATSAPGAAAKIVAALRAAAQAKPAALSKPAAERPPVLQEEANKGGTIPVMQKAQKKTDLAVPPMTAAPAAPTMPAAPRPEATGAAPPTPFALKTAPKAPEKFVAKPAKPAGNRHGFKTSEFIVYPAHGVGQIMAIEEQEVAGFKLELFVISFIKDKMILKVPTPKVASVGMRKLAEAPVVTRALETLTGRARIKRTMWSRRAQEYEAKINSGDLVAIAEVVRDLYRSDAQPEQSYSERQLYEAAVDRMGREIGAVNKLTETESLKLIEANLQKGPRRGKVEEADEGEDGDIEEAA